MANLVRNLCLAGTLAGLMTAAPKLSDSTSVQGVLIDKMCSYKAETRVVPGPRLEGGIVVAYTHTKDCALKPECQKSGYGVFTYDNKFVAFDEAGNQKALAFFKEAKQDDDFRVEVTGQVHGDTMSVTSIRLLP